METKTISKILNDLTLLLADELSPHSISCHFEKIAVLLSQENLSIRKVDCKEYYEDEDLSLILSMKNEALATGQFEQASKFRFIEIELLVEKGNGALTQLKTEPFFFEYKNNIIIFHFNKKKENQRLIANLIEGFNLIQKKADSTQRLSC